MAALGRDLCGSRGAVVLLAVFAFVSLIELFGPRLIACPTFAPKDDQQSQASPLGTGTAVPQLTESFPPPAPSAADSAASFSSQLSPEIPRLDGRVVGLYLAHFDRRGTGRGHYDYAMGMKELGARVIFFTAKRNFGPACPVCTEESIKRVTDNFEVRVWQEHNRPIADVENDMVRMIQQEKLDVLFISKAGLRKHHVNSNVVARIFPIPTMILCVFYATEPHGTAYTKISPVVPGDVPIIPRMVHLPGNTDDWRERLGIDADALVLGRHGGKGTFDDDMIRDGVVRALSARNDVHFVFLSTAEFGPKHERMHFLPPVGTFEEIKSFVNTCDGMIYGRNSGETFGLAIAEFSINNKPIIVNRRTEGFHRTVLEDDAFFVSSAEDVVRVVKDWDRAAVQARNWDKYTERFGKIPVMRQLVHVLRMTIATGELNKML